MLSHPMFMIRRGRYKYIHCDSDPALMFDVESDPFERVNLAQDTTHRARAVAFAAEVSARWDSDTIRDEVIASQRGRRVLHAAMEQGARTSWDFTPTRDAANEYVRNHMVWSEVGPRTRFPPL
jgi:choline-sulfatase